MMDYASIFKGDYPGHPFRGNQWVGGGGAETDRPRTRALTPEDTVAGLRALREAGVRIHTENGDADAAKTWREIASNKVSPQDLVRTMLGHSHDGVGRVDVYVNRDTITFAASNVDVYGARVQSMERTFYAHGEVHHDLLQVKEGQQGGGSVKALFDAAIPMYQRMGLKEVTVYANLEAGGYAWGRFGFRTDSPGSLSSGAKSSAEYYLQRNPISPDNKEALREMDDFKKLVATASQSRDEPAMLTNAKFPALDKHFAKEISDRMRSDYGGAKNDKVPKEFMRALLRDKSWAGSLNLSDKAQVDRVKAYCKKKK